MYRRLNYLTYLGAVALMYRCLWGRELRRLTALTLFILADKQAEIIVMFPLMGEKSGYKQSAFLLGNKSCVS